MRPYATSGVRVGASTSAGEHDEAERKLLLVRETANHHAALASEAEGRRNWNHFFTLLIFAMFVAALLGALVLGTRAYSRINALSDAANDRRQALGVVVNGVRAADAQGAVGTLDGPEGPALVLTEHLDSGDYETRFYLYKGNIVQEYTLAGTPCTPEKATVLAPSDSFSFDYKDGLLSITCDEGTADVALRNVQGGGR